MEQKEMKQMVDELIELRVKEGLSAMSKITKCKQVYEEMSEQGFTEEAKTFRQIVMFSAILHPDWTDEDMLEDFARNMGIENRTAC